MPHEFHEFSSMFPLLEGREFDELVADIEAHGQREIIVMLNNKVLDGRNRYLACKKLGKEPRKRDFQCIDGDPLAYVWSANVTRRHLDESQRSVAMAKRTKFLELGSNQFERVARATHPLQQDDAPVMTTKAAAKIANVSEATMKRARIVVDHGTEEEIASIESGKRKVYSIAGGITDRRIANGEIAPINRGRGNRVIPEDGLTIEELIRKGLTLEESGLTAEEVCKQLHLADETYRKFRDIVLLYDRDDLPEKDRVIVSDALSEINRTGRTYPHNSVKYLVDRVWGVGMRGSKREAKKLEDFDHAVNVIVYSSMAELEIPQLSKERAKELISELNESIKNINNLINKIKEIYIND